MQSDARGPLFVLVGRHWRGLTLDQGEVKCFVPVSFILSLLSILYVEVGERREQNQHNI